MSNECVRTGSASLLRSPTKRTSIVRDLGSNANADWRPELEFKVYQEEPEGPALEAMMLALAPDFGPWERMERFRKIAHAQQTLTPLWKQTVATMISRGALHAMREGRINRAMKDVGARVLLMEADATYWAKIQTAMEMESAKQDSDHVAELRKTYMTKIDQDDPGEFIEDELVIELWRSVVRGVDGKHLLSRAEQLAWLEKRLVAAEGAGQSREQYQQEGASLVNGFKKAMMTALQRFLRQLGSSLIGEEEREGLKGFVDNACGLLVFLHMKAHADPDFFFTFGPVGDLPLHVIYLLRLGVSRLCEDVIVEMYADRSMMNLPYISDISLFTHISHAVNLKGWQKDSKLLEMIQDNRGQSSEWAKTAANRGWILPQQQPSALEDEHSAARHAHSLDTLGFFSGETVLHIAIANRRVKVVERLLNEPFNHRIDVRTTGVFFAPPRVMPLATAKRSVVKKTAKQAAAQGGGRRSSTPEEAAVETGQHRYPYRQLMRHSSLLQTWFGKGSALLSNPDSVFYGGELPFSFAASVGDINIMKQLVERAKRDAVAIASKHHQLEREESNMDGSVTRSAKKEEPLAVRLTAMLNARVLNQERPWVADIVDALIKEAGVQCEEDVWRLRREDVPRLRLQLLTSEMALVRVLTDHTSKSPPPPSVSSEADPAEQEESLAVLEGVQPEVPSAGVGARDDPQWRGGAGTSGGLRTRQEIEAQATDDFINVKDSFGNTALHMAVWHDQKGAFDWIMANGGSKSLEALSSYGLTPFTLAAHEGRVSMFRHILKTHLSMMLWKYGPISCFYRNLAQLDTFRIHTHDTNTNLVNADLNFLPSFRGKPPPTPTARKPSAVEARDNILDVWSGNERLEVDSQKAMKEQLTRTALMHADENWRSALEIVILQRVEAIMVDSELKVLIKVIIKRKWRQFGSWMHLKRRVIPYGLLVACFTAMLVLRAQVLHNRRESRENSRPEEEWHAPYPLATHIFEMLVLAFLPVLAHFAWDNMHLQINDLDINMDGKTSTIERVLFLYKNVPAILDMLIMLGILLVALLRASGAEHYELNGLCMAGVLVWCNVLSVLAPYQFFGALVITIHKMLVGDVAKFLIIYMVLVMGFGLGLFVLIQDGEFPLDRTLQEDVECVDCADYLGTMLLKLIWVSVGEADQTELLNLTSSPNLAYGMHLVYVILSLVLLLNLIIAMMGDTYQRQFEDVEKEWFFPHAALVLKYERWLTNEQRHKFRLGFSTSFSNTKSKKHRGGRRLSTELLAEQEEAKEDDKTFHWFQDLIGDKSLDAKEDSGILNIRL